jgi:signal transduction histidine kinase
MLSVSRIESGRIQINITSFDIVELVKRSHDELQIKADEKKLALSFTSQSPQILVKGDSDKTQEVLINLLGNAFKFTEKGSVTTRIEERNGEVWIGVSDTGRGVAQEDLQKLFTKFGRLDSSLSTAAATTGTGLGLYICKKYVEAMSGHFEVESELGKGTTFAFTMPKSS